MTSSTPRRAHLITGGFPPGSPAGHDHDHARLSLLTLLAERDVPASVGNDFADLTRWLPLSRLLVTYVAGPFPDAGQCETLRAWLEAGGHWLALHGTSGGKAERVEGLRQRRTVHMPHHALLGGMFLTHPPLCRFQVDVAADHPVTQGLPAHFTVEDEPYFVALEDPAGTQLLLTAGYEGSTATSPAVGPLYGGDTSLLPDGRTRAIAYLRPVGRGAVLYCALGHCHRPAARLGPRDPADTTPAIVRGAWDSDAFTTLLGNAISWSLRP